MNDMLREMRLGLERFWGLRWLIKGPILAVLALIAISTIGAIAGGGGSNKPVAQVLAATETAAPATEARTATPQPTAVLTASPTRTPIPTPTPVPLFLTLDYPTNRATVTSPDMVMTGSALPHAEIRHDITGPDETLFADDSGHWQYPTTLKEGDNDFTFHLQDNTDITVTITIIYAPPPTPVPTPVPTSVPTPYVPPATPYVPPPPVVTQPPYVPPPPVVTQPPYNPYAGATAICSDGTLSFSAHRSGTCSHHGGVAEWCPCNAP